MSEQDDPRRRGFTTFSVRPISASTAEQRAEGARELRGIAVPPPSKPKVSPRPEPDPENDAPFSESTASEQSETGPERTRRTARKAPLGRKSGRSTTGSATLGTTRHRMRYVQFQVAPHLSDLLTARAEQEDVVLGQVVIDAVRAFDAAPDIVSERRRRRSTSAVRRQVLVRPAEADEIKKIADRQGVPSSALIRAALESYLP